jgi:serine/threonine protein kinase
MYIHSLHRMHRDIKVCSLPGRYGSFSHLPSHQSDNILMSLAGEIKLADFGYAAQLTKQKQKRNTIVGTRKLLQFGTFIWEWKDIGAAD